MSPFQIPPNTRAVGTGNPPLDMDNVSNTLTTLAGVNVQNAAYSGGAQGNGATDDTAAVAAALAALPAGGGVCYFPPGSYKITSGLTVPWNATVLGAGWGTQILFSGTGDCLRMQNPTTASGNFSTQQQQSGAVRDLMIDGTGAAAGSSGLHIGDGLGYEVRNVFIRNFTGTGSKGFWIDNNIWWTEKFRAYHCQTSNCTAGVVFDVTGTGTNSHAYGMYDFQAYVGSGQTGMILQGGSNPYAAHLRLTGNVVSGATALLQLTGASGGGSLSKIQDSFVQIRAETGAVSSNPQTINFGTTGGSGNLFTGCFGEMVFQGTWTATNGTNGNLGGFRGIVSGDTTLTAIQSHETVSTPAVPATGVTATNNTTANVMVYVSGGTVSNISVSAGAGQVSTGLTSGSFLLSPGGSIAVTYTVVPTWNWFRAAN